MPHYTPLITTIVAALTLAWAFAAVAYRLKLPPLVGYLLAGIAIGPFTPGYVADQDLAGQLAEIGVILLMFGVGLHFSLEDLLSVRKIAIPGAIVQILCATLLGMGLAAWLGWSFGAGLVFGLALSVASTVVLLRAMQERRLIETERGRIAVGWLIVEDIAMVLTLVLLPVVAGLLTGGDGGGADLADIALALALTGAKIAAFVAVMLIVEDLAMVLTLVLLPALAGLLKGESGGSFGSVALPLAITLGKVVAFVVFMLVIGRRVVPWLLGSWEKTAESSPIRKCRVHTSL